MSQFDTPYEERAHQRELEADESMRKNVRLAVKIVGGVVLALTLLIGGCMAGTPQYNLYKANTQKRERIAEAKADADAADYKAKSEVKRAKREAEAERIRAQGLADAQETINGTLTPEYIYWLYVNNLSADDSIVYIPTEGGLPYLGPPVTSPPRAE